MVPDIGIGFEKGAIEEPQALHKLCNWEINPGNLSCIVLFSFEKGIQLSKVWLELLNCISLGFLECLVAVSTIDKADIFRVKIPDNSHSCSNCNLLISISAQKFRFAGFVSNIDLDSITFRNNLITVQ